MLRTLLAVLAGLAVALLILAGIETLAHELYPPPAGLDVRNIEHVPAVMAAMPIAAKAIVVSAWLIGAFFGGLVVALITPTANRIAALFPAVAIVAVVVAVAMQFPQAQWMTFTGVPGALLAGWIGASLGRRLRRPRLPEVREWRGGDR